MIRIDARRYRWKPLVAGQMTAGTAALHRTTSAALGRQVLFSALLLLIACGAAMPDAGAEPNRSHGKGASSTTGSVSGTVQVGPEIEKRRVHFPIYADMSRQAPSLPEVTLDNELANVVVYLKPDEAAGSPTITPAGQASLRQIDESFEPHVLPILVGTTVEFPNADPFFHNVFSLSRTSAFDLGHYPKGSSRSVTFGEPGLVKVFCHLHSNMSAVIMVLDNPWFTVPDGHGEFRIDGVPPGRYTVTAWHERARPVRREVTIEAGRGVSLDLRVPINESPPTD